MRPPKKARTRRAGVLTFPERGLFSAYSRSKHLRIAQLKVLSIPHERGDRPQSELEGVFL